VIVSWHQETRAKEEREVTRERSRHDFKKIILLYLKRMNSIHHHERVNLGLGNGLGKRRKEGGPVLWLEGCVVFVP
jgi:hypothetical protein